MFSLRLDAPKAPTWVLALICWLANSYNSFVVLVCNATFPMALTTTKDATVQKYMNAWMHGLTQKQSSYACLGNWAITINFRAFVVLFVADNSKWSHAMPTILLQSYRRNTFNIFENEFPWCAMGSIQSQLAFIHQRILTYKIYLHAFHTQANVLSINCKTIIIITFTVCHLPCLQWKMRVECTLHCISTRRYDG